MGQAALDLPDPLQSPPQAPQTSTDELLAQLAGDEIDRLLSEADGSEPRAAAAPFHVAPPAEPGEEPQPQEAVPPIQAGQAAPEPSVIEQEVTAELDALFSAAVEKDKAREAADAATEHTSAAERAGLAEAPAVARDDDAPLPFYLRPLEWLSAPLMIFPPGVRDLIGKAAIVTLLNATAILIYVLVVRGR
jgi:hypothetical protein